MIGIFVVLNGFFVAAEFALIKVRDGQLDDKIAKGSGAAKIGKRMRENLNAYLSACQFGITVASLVLGALGERWIAALVGPAVEGMGWNLSGFWVHAISWTIAISALTCFHITLGEQVPKTLAIRRPLGTTLFSARPLHWFFTIFSIPVKLLMVFSNLMLKSIFRVDPVEEHELTHTADELALLVEKSEKDSEVTETERDILINALELNDLVVRDVMTARGDVICLDANDSFDKNVERVLESSFTRFPLVDGHLDEPKGLIHVKDVLKLARETNGSAPSLEKVKRELLEVPETLPIDELLGRLRNESSHLALAVDEFGVAAGVVTMEDVIEELVGEIRDEFDEEEQPDFHRIDERCFVVEGKMPMHELSDHTELAIEDNEVSTMGGYVTHLLGHLPEQGEKVRIENYEVTVTESDGRRVLELKFEKHEDESAFPPALQKAEDDGESGEDE